MRCLVRADRGVKGVLRDLYQLGHYPVIMFMAGFIGSCSVLFSVNSERQCDSHKIFIVRRFGSLDPSQTNLWILYISYIKWVNLLVPQHIIHSMFFTYHSKCIYFPYFLFLLSSLLYQREEKTTHNDESTALASTSLTIESS